MIVTCMTCQKQYEIHQQDSQYSKIKRGLSRLYVCKNCNTSIQENAGKVTGISAADLDPHQDILNKRRS